MDSTFHYIIPVVLGVIVVALVIRYFYWLVDRELADGARLEENPEFRREQLSFVDGKLAQNPEDAALLRRRADIQRFDGNHQGIIRDLKAYLSLRPEDDSAWHEVFESYYAIGDYGSALEAAGRAVDLDPEYIDYHAARSRAALMIGELGIARESLEEWLRLENRVLARETGRSPRMLGRNPVPRRGCDPYLRLMQAAVSMAGGDKDGGAMFFAEALEIDRDFCEEHISSDPALAELR